MWVIKIIPTEGHVIERRTRDWYEVLREVKRTRALGGAIFVELA